VQILREVSVAVGTGIGSTDESGIVQVALPPGALPPGMIGGQVVDIESEGVAPTAELVTTIHRAKTGALLTTSIVSGGLYGLASQLSGFILDPGATTADIKASIEARKSASGRREETIARLRTFGEKIGLAFQIVDDILDMTQSSEELGKTAGKDAANIKATWPAVYGIDQSRRDADRLIADAFAAVEPFGSAADPLKSLAQYLTTRTH
jgi:geranylgeranyl diphosphate synthase type II